MDVCPETKLVCLREGNAKSRRGTVGCECDVQEHKVEGVTELLVGAVYSPTRRRPKKAEVKAAHSIRASAAGEAV